MQSSYINTNVNYRVVPSSVYCNNTATDVVNKMEHKCIVIDYNYKRYKLVSFMASYEYSEMLAYNSISRLP